MNTFYLSGEEKDRYLKREYLQSYLRAVNLPDIERERDISFIKSSVTTTYELPISRELEYNAII